MGIEPQFVKLAEGFYLNLGLIIEINGNEVHYADGSVFTLDDECIKALTERLTSSLGRGQFTERLEG